MLGERHPICYLGTSAVPSYMPYVGERGLWTTMASSGNPFDGGVECQGSINPVKVCIKPGTHGLRGQEGWTG